MMSKYIQDSIVLVMLFIFERSFFSAFHMGFEYVMPVLLLIIFLTVLIDIRRAYIAGLFAGILFDAYSTLPSGTHIFSFLITIYLLNYLFIHVFTNRSFYVVSFLTFIGVFVYTMVLYGVDSLFYVISDSYMPLFALREHFSQYLALTAIYNTGIMMATYLFFRVADTRINPLRIRHDV